MPQGAADGADSNTRFEFLLPLFYQLQAPTAENSTGTEPSVDEMQVATPPRHRSHARALTPGS